MQPLDESDPMEIGRYRLAGRLGSGGMGSVYLGRSPGGRPAAVKVISDQFRNNPQALERFRREVETLRTLRSAYTAALIDSEISAPPYWLATEYVPGPTLDTAVAADGPLPADLCRALLAALAEGLGDIHTHGVWHRDIKPQNVILSATGPQLIDFGIARGSEQTALTQVGSMGTPGYTAPEILTHNNVGPAGDVFALGATIAFAATGRAPYGEGLFAAISYRAVHESVDLNGVEPALAELISACVTRDPRVRLRPDEIVARCQPQASLVDHPAYRHALTSASATMGLPTPPVVQAVTPAGQYQPTMVLPTAPTAPTGTPAPAPAPAAAAPLLHVQETVHFPLPAPGAVPGNTRQRRGRFILMGAAGVAVIAAAVLIAPQYFGQNDKQNEKQSAGNGGGGASEKPKAKTPPDPASLAHVQIMNVKTGHCADILGREKGAVTGPVNDSACLPPDEDNQLWNLEVRYTKKAPNESSLFQMRNTTDGFCMDLPNYEGEPAGTFVSEFVCDGTTSDNQLWWLDKQVDDAAGNQYWIRSYSSNNLCLVLSGPGNYLDGATDAPLKIHPCTDSDSALWTFAKPKTA
ncbi:serine/threonine protein kinase [Streptomyces sp. NPDC052236]|uniref:serine/threonine protein kinase n=1 Tax=Streptomyces sp. NPDC052236 TaxID=3365686 RepID=UPI0037D17540